MTHPKEESDTEFEGMPVTREAPGGETEYVQSDLDEVETEVDEVVGTFIKRSKSYNIYFQIRFLISYEEMK